jgi:riboflavin kinase/FMN adenylyltransferase
MALRIIDGVWDVPPLERPTVLTFGKFDALHLGHQAIFHRVLHLAQTTGRDAAALSFYPHPLKLLAPERCPATLTPLSKKLRLFEAFGFDLAIVGHFDDRMRTTKAEAFLELLATSLRAEVLVIGADARFGYRAQGDMEVLMALSERLGYRVEIVAPQQYAGQVISSQRVREAIQGGDLELAETLLGRAYSVVGGVVEGDKRGRTLGYPTANVETGDQLLPPFGIYVAEVIAGGVTYGAAVSLGVRPTFDGKRVVLEAYLLDFSGTLYGQEIEVIFREKIREELRFDNVEALLEQMAKDVQVARRVLNLPSLS